MIDFHDFLIGYIIASAAIGYLCFLVRNFYTFSSSDGWISYVMFVVFCFIPVIPDALLTINVAKRYLQTKKEKDEIQEPKIKKTLPRERFIKIETDEPLDEQSTM